MNILFLNNLMEYGGIERCIIQLTKELNNNNKVVVCAKNGPLTSELDSMKIKHYSINDTDNKSIKNIIKNILIIFKIIKEENIELVHSHHRMTTLYCKILRKVMNFKLVHTQHLCIEDKKIFTRIILRKLPVITVSNGARDNLIKKYGLKKDNIKTIYNTINKENSNNKIDKILLELNRKKIFTVAHISRLVDYKGIYDFVEIAKNISSKTQNIKFVIIGDGPERLNLQNYIKENNLEESVYMLGNRSNVINLLSYIDLVLLCSYIEGLPLVPLEAFSKGVPVIATNILGTNEEVIDNFNGFLVETKDINIFEERIFEIYKNKELYNKMKENCIRIFEEKFNSDIYIEKHIKFYNKIVKF